MGSTPNQHGLVGRGSQGAGGQGAVLKETSGVQQGDGPGYSRSARTLV